MVTCVSLLSQIRSTLISMAVASSSASSPSARRVFIITGSNTGVGLATARGLAAGDEPRHLILACRTPAKAQAAVDLIRAEIGPSSPTLVEWMQLDLTDYNSIQKFVADFLHRKLPLHVLLNNAGVNLGPAVLPQPLRCESMFVANYLGPWLLTRGLLPALESSAPSRVINVTSFMHRMGSADFESQMRSQGNSALTYSSSKLYQILHAYELHRLYAHKGVSALVVHPGACYSDIWNSAYSFGKPLYKLLFLTTAQGAASSIHAATKPIGDGRSADARGALLKPEHWGPYRVPGGWSMPLDAWQPACLMRLTQSRTADVTYDEKIADQLYKFSGKLCDEWEEAAKEK